jgi:ankyrin repeat protein
MEKNYTKELDFSKLLKKKGLTDKDVVSFLRNNIINLDQILPGGYNCLHLTIKTENPDIVSLLLSNNDNGTLPANPNIETADSKNNIYITPLQFAIQEVCDSVSLNKIVKVLIKNGANVFKTDELGKNILHLAAEKGNIELVSYILEKEPKLLNTVCKYGSMLHLAASNDHNDLVEEILNSTTIDLKLLDENKNSALLLSVVVKNFNCFKSIFDFIRNNTVMSNEEKKFLFNQKNEEGNCLLHELVYAKSYILLELMLKLPQEMGIDPNEKNNNNLTYKNLQENIVKMIKERDEEAKRKKEETRQEKLKLIEEKRKFEEELENEKKKIREQEQRTKEMQERFYKHKGKIMLLFFVLFMVFLYFLISNTLTKKKKVNII